MKRLRRDLRAISPCDKPSNCHQLNEVKEFKIQNTEGLTAHRRILSWMSENDCIKVVAIGFIVVSSFLAGSSTRMDYSAASSSIDSTQINASPRYIRHLLNETEQGVHVRRLDLNMDVYPSKRIIDGWKDTFDKLDQIQNSMDYKYTRADVFETAECKAQYPWQLMQFPTCNTVFENDMTSIFTESKHRMRARLIANGYWRDVWLVKEFNSSKRVLKTLRYEHEYEGRNYDRHKRDALAMERMTKSPHVVDIYGFCGNSGLFQYAKGGDITDKIWPRHIESNLTTIDKLLIATQVAMAVADVHNFDKEGQASVAHTDITPSQFILIDGVFKLNDFNRARFIRWSTELNEPCGYYVGKNPGKMRSPEEYKYEEQSEKVRDYNTFVRVVDSQSLFSDSTL